MDNVETETVLFAPRICSHEFRAWGGTCGEKIQKDRGAALSDAHRDHLVLPRIIDWNSKFELVVIMKLCDFAFLACLVASTAARDVKVSE